MSFLYTLFLVSSFLGIFSWAAPSSPSEPPRTVCVRRSVLLSFVIPPGSTFVPAVEGGLVVGNITSESPNTIPSAASSPSASESPSGSLSSSPEPNSTPFLPIHQLENVCNPGLFSDTTGTLYNLTCGWTATGNPVFEGSFRDIESCAGECSWFRNNGTGCESIIYNQPASTESQDANCRGIVEPSDPHAQNQVEYAVPVLYVTTSSAIPSAQLPTYITLSFPATPTLLTISTGPLDSDTSGTTSATLSLPTTSVSATLSSPISLATFSSTTSSSSLSLISTFSTDSAIVFTATSSTSSSSSSSLSSVVSLTISSTTPSFTSISSTESQASFSPSSLTTSSESSSSSSSLSAATSFSSTTSLSPSSTSSLENSPSSSSISTITLSTPSDAPASISTLSSSSFVDITATSPPLIVSSTTSTAVSSTSILSSTSFSTSSAASITPAPTSDCSYNYLQNGDFQTLVNGLPGPWIFEKDAADGDATSVSVEEVPHDPPQTPPDNDILMTINNTDQAAPTPSARSVSLRQNIPPLCPGAAYRLFWTNRITITNNSNKRKRAPVDAQNCTVGFDLLDQVISVMGGPNGAPLPYTQTTSGDIFRYQGYLDHNALTITLNCTAEYGEYRIDDVFLLGPTGSCCAEGSESATYNSTEYSLSTL